MSILLIALTGVASAAPGEIVTYPIPTPNSRPSGITTGPDGDLWFAEEFGRKFGRITTSGTVTEFPAEAQPKSIVAGPDGNLWSAALDIERITPDGTLTTFPLPPSRGVTDGVRGITNGPDGNLWLTWPGEGKVIRITPAGVTTEFETGIEGGPLNIATGPDGNLWFTDFKANEIGRMTPDGRVTGLFPVPTPESGVDGITAGPDGNLWFTEREASKIGRITPTGQITEFATPGGGSGFSGRAPDAITAGPDGNVWFTEVWGGRIARITPSGEIGEYPIPAAGTLLGITTGPDGNIWFTAGEAGVGRITPGGVPLANNLVAPGIEGRRSVGHTLRAVPGAWTNSPSSFLYHWETCDRRGKRCRGIRGAEQQTFVPRKPNTEGMIRVRVEAITAAGTSDPAESAAVGIGPPRITPTAWALARHPRFPHNNSRWLTIETSIFYCAGEPAPRIDHLKVAEHPPTEGGTRPTALITVFLRYPVPGEVAGAQESRSSIFGPCGSNARFRHAVRRVRLKQPVRHYVLMEGNYYKPSQVWPIPQASEKP